MATYFGMGGIENVMASVENRNAIIIHLVHICTVIQQIVHYVRIAIHLEKKNRSNPEILLVGLGTHS